MTVLCWIETDAGGAIDPSRRALAVASGLAASGLAGPGLPASAGHDLAACWFGEAGAVSPDDLAAAGASQGRSIASAELSGYAPAAWARALAGLAAELGASAVVAAATDRGNEVLAHLGAITGQPMAANCLAAQRRDDGGYQLTRQRWAGLLLEEALLDAAPALLTVSPDGVAAAPAPAPATLVVQPAEIPLADGDLRVRAQESAGRAGGVSLATARVVVGGGRGVGGADGFAPLEELAGLLGGVLGVSRVVTSEGWRPHRQQVGQTGTKITPELYLACGISGAIQHMAGCQGARHIVAINTDPDAPIMNRADYAVIGNLHEVIPALADAIRARTGSA
jgi:electron transfer flavoprotein alpha subunit